MKNVCILTEEGRGYKTEGLKRIEKDIFKLFQETEDLNFVMGHDLNNPEILIEALRNENTGYLFTSLEDMGYFHPASEFPILIKLFEKHPNENTWSVLAPIIQKGLTEKT